VPYQKFQSCLIKERYLGNFNKDSCGIKILYGGAGREYGGGKIFSYLIFKKCFPENILKIFFET